MLDRRRIAQCWHHRGDVKSDNVLIDGQDDAWVIDFGGGYTEGWVDKECSETLAGDAQELTNILRLIGE